MCVWLPWSAPSGVATLSNRTQPGEICGLRALLAALLAALFATLLTTLPVAQSGALLTALLIALLIALLTALPVALLAAQLAARLMFQTVCTGSGGLGRTGIDCAQEDNGLAVFIAANCAVLCLVDLPCCFTRRSAGHCSYSSRRLSGLY